MAERKGSGWFSVAFGIAFVATFLVSLVGKYDLTKIEPYYIFQAWLLMAGIFLIGWGANRISGKAAVVGQPTILYVVTIIAVAIALLTIVKTVPPSP